MNNEREYGTQGAEVDLDPEMWDKANLDLIPDIFHPDFTFRGSLGPQLVGHAEFSQYVKWVTGSIEKYTSDILEMVEEGNKICGKLIFHGIQRKELFGTPPSGAHVWWYGAPIFTFEGDKVRDLWVLGDVHGFLARADERTVCPEFSL
jgi:predicted ester cyclase